MQSVRMFISMTLYLPEHGEIRAIRVELKISQPGDDIKRIQYDL